MPESTRIENCLPTAYFEIIDCTSDVLKTLFLFHLVTDMTAYDHLIYFAYAPTIIIEKL